MSEYEKAADYFRLRQHLKPLSMPDKEKFLNDLYNISDSFIGSINTMFLNAFMFECEYLIINAIELFEKGYFDCSCYSLRQALELANNMAYFSELSDAQRKVELEKWGLKEKLEAKKVGNFLSNYSENYKEMKVVFKEFFDKIIKTKEYLNTIVHKQGFESFYYTVQQKCNANEILLNNFIESVKVIIGAVAVLRLTIDPFPILLMDEEIIFRLPDLLTESFSIDFIHDYIGADCIIKYKETKLYSSCYNEVIIREKMNEVVSDIVKNQFINVERCEEICQQMHLLCLSDRVALFAFLASDKIAKIYTQNGFTHYTSNTKSENNTRSFSSSEIQFFKSNDCSFNQEYNNVFMSYLTETNCASKLCNKIDISFYLEHNQELSNNEITLITTTYKGLIESAMNIEV